MSTSDHRILAIECATQACSVALFSDGALIDAHHQVIGRGHAERLIPLIASLPNKGRATHIRVSLGPGSFTGVRIGIAAARALALAWGAEITGFPTLSLVAAMAQQKQAHPITPTPVTVAPVTVAMRGGHGEWFMQDFSEDGLPQTDLRSLAPDIAAQTALHNIIAGDQADALVALRGSGEASPFLPDARLALKIPDSLLSLSLKPIYGRTPDAKPQVQTKPAKKPVKKPT